MNRTKIDLKEERNIITNMIMSDNFLKEISRLIQPEFFESDYAKIVSSWVNEYFENFNEAPKQNIQDIFQKKSTYLNSDEVAESISDFLYELSEDYKNPTNLEYTIEQAQKYLKLQSLSRLSQEIKKQIITGSPEKAEHLVASYKRVERSTGDVTNITKDADRIISAFSEEQQRLFKFHGVLGDVIGYFERGELIAYLAFTNKGKTWWQLEVARLAAVYGYKAIIFSLEQPQAQIDRRVWTMNTGQPRDDVEYDFPFFEELGNGKFTVNSTRKKKKGFDAAKVGKIQKNLKMKYRTGSIIVKALPAMSATVDDLEMILDNLAYYDDFVPDVIIADYADIIAPNRRLGEHRHELNSIWKHLRGMAQRRNAAIISATQSNRSGANRDVDIGDIGEDIRKSQHVSKLISINQTELERQSNLIRLANHKERDGYLDKRQVGVLQCLDIGKTYIDSRLMEDIELEVEDEEEDEDV
jgi:replicative DNA helicase